MSKISKSTKKVLSTAGLDDSKPTNNKKLIAKTVFTTVLAIALIGFIGYVGFRIGVKYERSTNASVQARADQVVSRVQSKQ